MKFYFTISAKYTNIRILTNELEGYDERECDRRTVRRSDSGN